MNQLGTSDEGQAQKSLSFFSGKERLIYKRLLRQSRGY